MVFGLAINIAGNRTRFGVGVAKSEQEVIADTATELDIDQANVIVIPIEQAIKEMGSMNLIAFLAPAELEEGDD